MVAGEKKEVFRGAGCLCFLVVLLLSTDFVKADTPANCTYEDIVGEWTFYTTDTGYDRSVNCSKMSTSMFKGTYGLKLYFPSKAVDHFGNEGFWTLIYNQGFEVVLQGRKYFAFSRYEGEGPNATSVCSETLRGLSHNVVGRGWACFYGMKQKKMPAKTLKISSKRSKLLPSKMHYEHDPDFINKINSVQTSWKAGHYKEYETFTNEEMIRRAGGRKSMIHGRPKPAPVTMEIEKIANRLPMEFDWRNVHGVNYLSPVRNQGSCGSCYAFASMGMHEARIRIMTNNSDQTILSPQDIVECSSYSQGCEGGFPYLIAGKYAEDFGLAPESCNPYKGTDGKCSTVSSCVRRYGTSYQYVGGFYGGCNEALMRIQLVKSGPMAVAFEVYNDFLQYKGGIYHHTGLKSTKFDPFEITNHAVLLVGYGYDNVSGEKYWIVKNSWGTTWGEDGFFRIRRGTDECAIESIAVESTPVF